MEDDSSFHALLEAAPDAMIVVDAQGIIRLVNRRVEELFGHDRDELVGKEVEVLIPRRFRAQHPEHRHSYFANPKVRPMGIGVVLFGLHRDGREIEVEVSLSPMTSADQPMVVAAIRDVHDRRDAEQQIRSARLALDSDRVLSTLLGNLPGMVYRCRQDAARSMVFVSGGCLGLTGHLPDDYMRQRVSLSQDVMHRDDRERVLAAIDAAAQTGAPVHLEYRIRTANGREKWVMERGVPVDREEDVLHFEGFINDITDVRHTEMERDRLRREAQQRTRLADVGAIAAKIAHDIGNPLAGLLMQAQLIARSVERGDPITRVAASTEQVITAARQMDLLLREFREFLREQRLELRTLCVRDLLSEIREQWEVVASDTGIDLGVDVEPGLESFRADPMKIHRVLDNLVRNAIEALERGPGAIRIEAKLHAGGEMIRISVVDSGPGVDPSIDVFRLFETTKPAGTGLGLPICRQMVHAHGGEITFDHVLPQGTVFHVDLPLRGPG